MYLLALLLAGFSTPGFAADPLPGGLPPITPPGLPSLPRPRVDGGSDDNSETEPPPPAGPTGGVNEKKVPCVPPSTKVTMDYVDASLMDITRYMAEITCRNFILSDDLKGQITIISHQQVSVSEAYEAYLSALEVAGYTTVTVGKNTKVVATGKAGNAPLKIYEDGDIPATDNFVTQIIQLDNTAVADISGLVKDLAGPSAKIIGYSPTNTLIITDAAYNIRRVYRIVKQLDVAAPKSRLEVIPIRYATAAAVEKILEEVYGVAASSGASAAPASSASADRASRRKTRDAAPAADTSATATTVGADATYISKIISDERTNSLIVLANEQALVAIKELIARVDVDIDPASRSQIHVIYLQHAKATDVANVLGNLSQGGRGSSSASSSSSSSRGTSGTTGTRRSTGQTGGSGSGSRGGSQTGRPEEPGGAGADGAYDGAPGQAGGVTSGGSGVVAAFDSGMRVTADENTNSLVIIAAPEDFQVLKGVVDRLDISRRQVYVEAVVVEVGSTDTLDLGIAYHGGAPNSAGDGIGAYGSGQLGASSASLPIDTSTGSLLSGLAVGIMGAGIPLDFAGTTVNIPAFGIALNALASNSDVDILSNPNLLVVDNEQATLTVGRNVPFPVSSGYSSTGQPVISYQRQDVGITLELTPQINEANEVTMDISLEVAEVEEGTDSAGGGFTTSKRKTENVVVVQDNQTIVIGGLIGNTDTKGSSKIPILGDIPLIGFLFRGKTDTERKTNLLIFLTPHVINEPSDLEEVYRVKMAQREEFLRRFYGKSREEQEAEFRSLMTGSMNFVDAPSVYRTKAAPVEASVTLELPRSVPDTRQPAPPVPPAPEPAIEAPPAAPAEGGS
ncbi:MAG: type II secretion system protein GspD [Myxococcales bacterium]|nr:type II secretion system protein GspD [Myxococcales bacterium]